jgi:hypothetical protein
MSDLFSADYWLLWALILGVALFLPVRNLIFVLYMRRASRTGPAGNGDRERLRRRASVTAGLLCFLFAILYSQYLFFGRT